MQKTLGRVGLIILFVLVLIYLYNRILQQDEAPTPGELADQEVRLSPEPPPLSPPGRSDGAFESPVLPLEQRSVAKRDGEGRGKDAFDLMMERFQPCEELLEEAVAQGTPNPDTAGLGGAMM